LLNQERIENSSVYEGDWANGEQSGHGRMTYTDGTVHEVIFVDSDFARL